MLQVGLTGGFACGKSFVGQILQRLGCLVLQADQLGHQVLRPEGEAYGPAVQEFGPGILDDQGSIDRRKLAAIVFQDPEKLARLSAIVHPAVAQLQAALIAQTAQTEPGAIVVVEAAILVETGSYRNYDRLILVECTPEQQIARAMQRGALSRQEVLERIGRQLPLEEKRRVAHYRIDASGDRERTVQQTEQVYRSLRSLAL